MKNNIQNILKLSRVKPKYVILVSVVIALTMIISAYFELTRSKEELYHLLEEFAHNMLYTVDISSENTVISDQEIENLLTVHLLGVARNVAMLENISGLSDELLVKIADDNDIYRINVFDEKGNKVYTNYREESAHSSLKPKYSPLDYIAPILKGDTDEVVIGLKEARFEEGSRFAVAVKRPPPKKGAIIVNLDAESYLEFREKTGFGKMILDIGSSDAVAYVVLQNENEIIAANKPVEQLSAFSDDYFLKESYEKDTLLTRIFSFEDKDLLEAVKPFKVEGEKSGLFRIGLNMDEIHSLENRMFRRIIIMSLVLLVIAVAVISFIISNQNLKIISKEYKKVQTFTGNILENLSQSVITIDENNAITIFNKNAEELFGINSQNAIGKKANEVFASSFKNVEDLFHSKKEIKDEEFEIVLDSAERKLINANSVIIYGSGKNIDSYTLVLKDITELKQMEKHIQQKEKLSAMGELASGVAHEVRNPLNTINMIAQRFEKEFVPKIESEDFKTITNVLKSESERVENIVRQFLRFAKPPKLNIEKINARDFLGEIRNLALIDANSKNIEFIMEIKNDSVLNIDREQMKQALMNLIKNSAEATKQGGRIDFIFKTRRGKNIFEIADNGCGIPKENLNKIFNLYFTTKSSGTGLGLSIVQQIISQHDGTIYVESSENKGTKFVIEI